MSGPSARTNSENNFPVPSRPGSRTRVGEFVVMVRGRGYSQPSKHHPPMPWGARQDLIADPSQSRLLAPSAALRGRRTDIERRPSRCANVVVPMNHPDQPARTQDPVTLSQQPDRIFDVQNIE